jgi:SAM-dependent methyltransferase
MKDEQIKQAVRESYGSIARESGSCCDASADTSCCGNNAEAIGEAIGYSTEDIRGVPEGANLGLGCGNPLALATVREGETVLDLGAGAGFDCFIAAKKVGAAGDIIGVDMTPAMVDKARENARRGGYDNVEFRLGEIENLPVADGSVDLVISNCVINLSTNKGRVFREALRVLKPGGRLAVSDIVLTEELPQTIRESMAGYVGCVSGAELRDRYLVLLKDAGFHDVRVEREKSFVDADEIAQPSDRQAQESPESTEWQRRLLSISVTAYKP